MMSASMALGVLAFFAATQLCFALAWGGAATAARLRLPARHARAIAQLGLVCAALLPLSLTLAPRPAFVPAFAHLYSGGGAARTAPAARLVPAMTSAQDSSSAKRLRGVDLPSTALAATALVILLACAAGAVTGIARAL